MSDVSQLRAFAARLSMASSAIDPKIVATTNKAAMNIKKAVMADLHGSSSPGMRRIPIEYSQTFLRAPGEYTVQVGPSAKVGGLANIAFFGTSRGGGSHKFYEHADAEAPNWAKYVGEAAGRV